MITENFDLPILDWITEHLYCDFLDFLMPAITHLGDSGILWIAIAAICICIPKYRKAGLTMAVSLLMGLLICNVTLKPLVARIRPFDYVGKEIALLIPKPHDFSFPSGHTNASFAAATALLLHHRKIGVPAMILAVLIAFSRLYLYVHYPTDVLASVALGISLAFLAHFLVNKGTALYEHKNNR